MRQAPAQAFLRGAGRFSAAKPSAVRSNTSVGLFNCSSGPVHPAGAHSTRLLKGPDGLTLARREGCMRHPVVPSETAPEVIEHPRGSSRLIRVLTVGLVLAALAQFALFTAVLGRTMIREPVGDMFGWIDDYLRLKSAGGVLAYLWAPHNEHHIPLIRILTALDMSAFRGNEVVFVLVATISLLAAAALIFLELRRDRSLVASPGSLAVVGAMLVLTATAALDCALPVFGSYPMTLFFVVAALILFDGETERTRITNAKRGLALFTAVLAALANGVGLIVWPALLWTAWRGAAARSWLFAIAAVGAGYFFIYTRGVTPVGAGNPHHIFDLSHLWKMFEYFLTYLALPLSRERSFAILTRALGAVLLCMAVIVILRDALSPRPPTRLQRIAAGLIIAGLASGLLAAVGRVDIDAEVKVPVRYALLVSPLQIGLLATMWPWLARRAVMLRREAAMLTATVALCWALVAAQVVEGLSAVAVSDEIRTTVEHSNGAEAGPGMVQVGFPDPAVIQRVRSALRASEQSSGRPGRQ